MIAPDGPFELPDCDPPALRAAAAALSGLGGQLADQAGQVEAVVGASTTWTGEAQGLWASVGGRERDDLRVAHTALADAASALTVLAGRLEDAQTRYSTHMTHADDAMREALQQRGAASTAGRPAPDTSELDARARREERAATSAAQDARAAAQAAAAEFDRIAGQAPQPPIVIPPTGETITPGDARPTPALLTTLLGMVRVDAQGEPIEIDLQDPESIRGANLDELVAAARALGWVEGDPAKAGGGGFRFFKPGTNNSQGIRLMFGDLKAPAGSGKQDPYALITRPGAKGNEKVRVPLEGNPEVENQGGPGTYASGRVPPPEPAPVRVPGEGPVDPEPVQPVEPVEPVEPIEPIGPEDLIP